MELLYLSQADVAAVGPSMAEIVDLVEQAFREKGLGRVEMPPKPGLHPAEEAFIHAMPAYIPALRSAGVKWVSGFPQNMARGLPYISGLLILNDPKTGFPLAVMDCTWITAMRTGAATAVAAKYLARPESRRVGILGCGVQGRSNLYALRVVFPAIDTVHAYDVHPENARRYQEEIEAATGLPVTRVSTPREAVEGMDLVVTAGPILKHPTPAIEAGWLKPGGFASPVDFDSYWQPEALAEIDKFCTDDHAQFEYYQRAGYFQKVPPRHADLGEIVAGLKPGRETDTERTMAMNLGLAIHDMATAIRVYERARAQGIGTLLPL